MFWWIKKNKTKKTELFMHLEFHFTRKTSSSSLCVCVCVHVCMHVCVCMCVCTHTCMSACVLVLACMWPTKAETKLCFQNIRASFKSISMSNNFVQRKRWGKLCKRVIKEWVKFSADDMLKYFSYFSQKSGFGSSCKLSPQEIICMKS